MTEGLQADIIQTFERHFLANEVTTRPAWSHDPQRSSYFELFVRAQAEGEFDGDAISEFLQNNWIPNRPDLDRDDRTAIRNICRAWGEWLYAVQQLKSLRANL